MFFDVKRVPVREFDDFKIELVYGFIFPRRYEAISEKRNMRLQHHGCDGKAGTFDLNQLFRMIHVVRDNDMDYVSHAKDGYMEMLSEEKMRLREHRAELDYATVCNMEYVLKCSKPLKEIKEVG